MGVDRPVPKVRRPTARLSGPPSVVGDGKPPLPRPTLFTPDTRPDHPQGPATACEDTRARNGRPTPFKPALWDAPRPGAVITATGGTASLPGADDARLRPAREAPLAVAGPPRTPLGALLTSSLSVAGRAAPSRRDTVVVAVGPANAVLGMGRAGPSVNRTRVVIQWPSESKRGTTLRREKRSAPR